MKKWKKLEEAAKEIYGENVAVYIYDDGATLEDLIWELGYDITPCIWGTRYEATIVAGYPAVVRYDCDTEGEPPFRVDIHVPPEED